MQLCTQGTHAHHTGHSPRLNLLGVSTVACNQTVEKTTVNALSTLYVAGLQHIGMCAAPLHRHPHIQTPTHTNTHPAGHQMCIQVQHGPSYVQCPCCAQKFMDTADWMVWMASRCSQKAHTHPQWCPLCRHTCGSCLRIILRPRMYVF